MVMPNDALLKWMQLMPLLKKQKSVHMKWHKSLLISHLNYNQLEQAYGEGQQTGSSSPTIIPCTKFPAKHMTVIQMPSDTLLLVPVHLVSKFR